MKLSSSIIRSILTPATRLRRIINRSLATWLSIAGLILIASIQPSANALEFPMVTRVLVPDAASLTAQPDTTVALFTQLQTTAIVNSDEIAQASLESGQIEMARTQSGAQTVAKEIMALDYNWNASQFGCLKSLWTYESHWNYKAHNYSSGAHGIAQALPADKMEVIATDWRTNPLTQIRWGLRYIDIRYDTPCKALGNFNRNGSY